MYLKSFFPKVKAILLMQHTLSVRHVLTILLILSEDVILLNLTCNFFIKEIKKVAVVKEVLSLRHGWINCDSPQRPQPQSFHQLVERVEILLPIRMLQ